MNIPRWFIDITAGVFVIVGVFGIAFDSGLMLVVGTAVVAAWMVQDFLRT